MNKKNLRISIENSWVMIRKNNSLLLTFTRITFIKCQITMCSRILKRKRRIESSMMKPLLTLTAMIIHLQTSASPVKAWAPIKIAHIWSTKILMSFTIKLKQTRTMVTKIWNYKIKRIKTTVMMVKDSLK